MPLIGHDDWYKKITKFELCLGGQNLGKINKQLRFIYQLDIR